MLFIVIDLTCVPDCKAMKLQEETMSDGGSQTATRLFLIIYLLFVGIDVNGFMTEMRVLVFVTITIKK